MSIALFFITHQGIAGNLLRVSETIIQKPGSNLGYIEVAMDASIDKTIDSIKKKLKQLSMDDGILFITDMYGSTPGNIAQQLAIKYNANLVSGVNLPMVIRLLNYRDETQQVLQQKALDGGRHGIRLYLRETSD
jgi:PTS system mannose-specific IIA component